MGKKCDAVICQGASDACECEAVFKCANQFRPQVHLGFQSFVSDVSRETFQTKVFWLTLSRLYLPSLSIFFLFPCLVTYQTDRELKEIQLRLKRHIQMQRVPIKKNNINKVENWIISTLNCCIFILYLEILKICSKCQLCTM